MVAASSQLVKGDFFLHTHFLPAKKGVDFSFGGETDIKGFGMWLGRLASRTYTNHCTFVRYII